MDEIKYCIYCKGKSLKKKNKFLICLGCMKFKIPNENCTPEYVNAKYADTMKYCYKCGSEEELDRDEEENLLTCLECCKLKIELAPSKTIVNNEKQDKKKPEITAAETEDHKYKEEKNAVVQQERNQKLEEKDRAGLEEASVATGASNPQQNTNDNDAANGSGTVKVNGSLEQTKEPEGVEPLNLLQDNDDPLDQISAAASLEIVLKEIPITVRQKWKVIGMELKLPKEGLDKCGVSWQDPSKAFNLMLSLWKSRPAGCEEYTWSAFYRALNSYSVNEKETAIKINSILNCEYPKEFDEDKVQKEEDDDEFHDIIKECASLRPIGKKKHAKKLLTELNGTGEQDFVSVHFQVVLPSEKWDLKNNEELYVLFSKLNDSSIPKCLQGPFTYSKRNDELTKSSEEYLYEAILPIPRLLMSPIHRRDGWQIVHYKYAVVDVTKKESSFKYKTIREEDLCIGGREWRALYISKGIPTHLVKQFDPVILPPGSVGYIKAYLGNPKGLIVDSVYSALKFYLGLYSKLWLISEHGYLNEEDIKCKEAVLLELLHSMKTQTSYSKLSSTIIHYNLDKEFSFYKIVLHELSCAIDNFSCMDKVHGTLIVAQALKSYFSGSGSVSNDQCYARIKGDLNPEITKKLIRGFHIPMQHSQQWCSIPLQQSNGRGHYDDFLSFLKSAGQDLRDLLTAVIATLSKALLEYDDMKFIYDWLKSLPLLHALKDIDHPMKSVKLTAHKDSVYSTLFGVDKNYFKFIESFQKKFYQNQEFFEPCFQLLESYFYIDQLMPKVWITFLPIRQNYPLEKYPQAAPFACWHVGNILKDSTLNIKVQWKEFLLNMIAALKMTAEIPKLDESLCFKGAGYILKHFENITTKCYIIAFKLYLEVLKMIDTSSATAAQHAHESVQYCVKSVQKWIQRQYGDHMVGSKVHDELEDWSALLQVSKEVHVSHMMKNLTEEIHESLSRRLNDLDLQSKAKVIVNQNVTDQAINESLTRSFLSSQTASNNTGQQLLSLINETKNVSNGTLTILEGILLSEFQSKEAINISSIFSHVLCDCLIIYDKCIAAEYHFSQDYQAKAYGICEKSEREIVSLLSNLQSRSITIEGLDALCECQHFKTENMKKIFNAFLKLNCSAVVEGPVLFESLLSELKAYEYFKQRKKKVMHLALKALDIAKDEALKVKEELSDDFTKHPVKDVWKFSDDSEVPHFLVPGLDCASEDIINEVYSFTSLEECAFKIFKNRWANAKNSFIKENKNSAVSIAAFVSELWVPVMKEFRDDLTAISDDLKLPLQKVTELFEGLSDRKSVEEELEMWFKAFKLDSKAEWIRNTAQKIIDYQQLTYYAKSAHTLMQLKNSLNLKGDFNILNKLLENEEESSTSDLTLASVDTSAKETVGVLKDIAEHPSRQMCLEVFCSCSELVDWIRKMAKNVGMLAEVVQVANQTMEGDMIKQLLSDLLVFGSAFAPLIYDISPNESCESLVNRCKSLWTFLDTHPDLHSIAELCNERLGEFLRIEEALTDFQKSNVELMNIINKQGIYAVSAVPGKIHHSTEDAIRLRLREVEKENEQKVFSLSDLKELQSKLVLAAAENADSVKRFIEVLSRVERIAELVIKLQESGLIDYTHYTLTFGCSSYKKNEIDAHIDKLGNTLQDWKKSVQTHRKKYPQLNFYTSQQILDLQKEFGKLKSDSTVQPTCKLMLLLLSITASPSQEKIMRAIKFVLSKTKSGESNHSMTKSVSVKKPLAIFNTSKTALPKVSDLSEDEREIYDRLTKEEEYSPVLVMKAFEACSKPADEDELMLWCMDNETSVQEDEGLFILEDVDAAHESVDQGIDSEVTEDDEQVKQLVEEEYSLDMAIQAVKLSKSLNISPEEAVLSLELGKSPTVAKKTGWSIPSKYSQIPFNVKIDVPKNHYITLVELGDILKELACTIGEKEVIPKERPLRQRVIEKGNQNLLVTNEVWKTVLFLYMADTSLPLPTSEEVLICTETTSAEEVTLLWHRAVNDTKGYRLFTLVHGERLPFKVCEEVLNNLESITQAHSDFKIAIVVNAKEQSKSYITSRLGAHLRHIPALQPDDEVASYIREHTQSTLPPAKGTPLSDDERKIMENLKYSVQVAFSVSCGMGKSLRVRRFAQVLKEEFTSDGDHNQYVCIPIHGPEVCVSTLLEQLKPCNQDPNNPYPQLIHFNVATSMVEQIDWLLFQILFLGSLADQYGNVWRKVPTQVCVVECTLMKLEGDVQSCGKWNYNKEIQNPLDVPPTYALLSFLPQVFCVSPKVVETLANNSDGQCNSFDETIFKKENVQRVFQYLRRFDCSLSLDNYVYSKNFEGKPEECLLHIFKNMQLTSEADGSDFDPSWSEVHNFITFLNTQLCDCETSIFSQLAVGMEGFKGFKDFIVQFSIVMAKEFTEPSLKIGRYKNDVTASNLEELYSVTDGKSWKECAHPYLLFNRDSGHSITFMGLWIDERGNLIHIKDDKQEVAESNYMKKELRETLRTNGVKFMEEYSKLKKKEMLEKLIRVLGIDERDFKVKKKKEDDKKDDKKVDDTKVDFEKFDPDESYVLTLDNLMKMLAIHMKFRCGIPVIMMGETGCGKTRLLRYLCEVLDRVFETKTLSCLKVHGGTNKDRIIQEVEKAIELAEKNKEKHNDHVYTVLFFDEVNTTEALDLVKEIICDRTLFGKPLPETIKFAAACNPYRVHDEDTLKSLQTAGLGFYLRDEERIPKLGSIPLRKLVYRVLPLPPSLNQYVYDFGTVSGDSEGEYIQKIVINQIKDCQHIPEYGQNDCQKFLFVVLKECQWYMRNQKNECKYVSLRDVVRAMLLFKFFLDKLKTVKIFRERLLEQIDDNDSEEAKAARELNDITRALIYSVSVCYYARLSDKVIIANDNESETEISENVENQSQNYRKQFVTHLVEKFSYGEYHLKVDSVISKVTLFESEIVRLQTVFINAMNVPANIACNAALRENVFMMAVCIENRLPLFIVGKPGSSKSLAKSIVANSMQGQYSSDEFLTHFKQIQLFPYQCNQFSTTDTLVEVFEEAKKFQKKQKDFRTFASIVVLEEIGLAEDTPGLPLKVLHPYLEDGTAGINPDDQDIKPEERVAFIGISNWALDPAKMNRGIMVTRSSPAQQELLESAYGIAKMVGDEFVRDELHKSFDVLAEMYRKICEAQETEHDDAVFEAREFYGLRDFYTMIKMLCWKCIETRKHPTPEDFRYIILRNFSGHSFINPLLYLSNPSTIISMSKDENEDLNIIRTSLEPIRLISNNSALKRDNRYLLFITENQSALGILRTHLLKDDTPYICYGSSFPKDKEYTQVCVNINKIKVCMERGIPVILLNYEQIYESLYDVLNQCYTELHTGRYVDLGLRSYKIKCRVHENFRLIIIAEKSKVFTEFPIALINRLEKHTLVSKTILTANQKMLLAKLEDWVKQFSCMDSYSSKFVAGDAFVGHQDDTVATVLLAAIHQTHDDTDEDQILKVAKEMHLQIASCDALARLHSTSSKLDQAQAKEAFNMYFSEQEHFCLSDFLEKTFNSQNGTGSLVQITTYGPLLGSNHKLFTEKDGVYLRHISEFDTEIDFCGMLSEHFEAEKPDGPRILIIQCEWERWNSDLIACARHRVQDQMIDVNSKGVTHVIFIIHLARVTGGSTFTSFLGSPWLCVHIDDLTSPRGLNKILSKAFTSSISEFFRFLMNYEEVPSSFNVCTRIKENIQVSLARTVSYNTYSQIEKLIGFMITLIDNDEDAEDGSFTSCLLMRIEDLLCQSDSVLPSPKSWAIDAAMNKSKLHMNLTLTNTIKRLLDSQLQKLLSYIITRCNVNHNIGLLANSKNKLLNTLWIDLFKSDAFFKLNYEDSCSVQSVGNISNQFQSKFPFSWEITEQINAVLHNLVGRTDDDEERSNLQDLFNQFVSTLELQAFAETLKSVPQERSAEFYDLYLHDYINILHLPFEDIESAQKTICKAIMELSCIMEPAIGQSSPYPLIHGIASIHLAYSIMEKEIFWFSEICARNPELPSIVLDMDVLSSGKVVFHITSMKCAIDKVNPALIKKEWNENTTKEWLHHFHEMRNIVETILNFQTDYDEETKKTIVNCRLQWQKTQAVVLLAEHVVMNITYEGVNLFIFIKRYTSLLSKLKFTQQLILVNTLKQIQSIIKKLPVKQQPQCELCKQNLNLKRVVYLPCSSNHILCKECYTDSRKKRGYQCPCCHEPITRANDFEIPEARKKDYEVLRSAQQNCMDFFMEMISQCCFSSLTNESPDDEFFEELLKIITDIENDDYKQLFPLDEEYTHSCPIARSVLLQELLERNPEKVKKKLQEYQNYIKSEGYESDDAQLTLLCIKSIEDGFHKKCLLKSKLDEQINFACHKLRLSLNVLREGDVIKEYKKSIPIQYMECIAQVRFGLCFTSKMLYKYYCSESDTLQQLPSSTKLELNELCSIAKSVITDGVLPAPRDFLIKQFVREYGFTYLNILSKQENFNWIMESNQDSSDELAVCGSHYVKLRNECCFGNSSIETHMTELEESFVAPYVIVSLAILKKHFTVFEKPTISAPSKFLLQVQKEIKTSCNSDQKFVKTLNLHINVNENPSDVFLPWRPQATHQLLMIVVQFATTVSTLSVQEHEAFYPFACITRNDDNLKDYFWPGMPDHILDVVMSIKDTSKNDAYAGRYGAWWTCENGHPYYVADCGNQINPGDEGKSFTFMRCPDCGISVGGRKTNEKRDQLKIDEKVREYTKRGHCLDPPNRRSSVPIPLREELSPISHSIMLIFVHASCIWSTCLNQKGLSDSINSDLNDNEVFAFFWNHLEKDLEMLSRASQLCFDDCVLLILSLVNSFLAISKVPCKGTVILKTREDRKTWEELFDQEYIQPFTNDLEAKLQSARNELINDCSGDYKKLYEMIYEQADYSSTLKIDPHLWIYRPIITLDHVARSLQLNKDSMKGKVKVLEEFLKKVDHLSVIHYLPDIIQMQLTLYELCNHRIDKQEAMDLTIEEFVKQYMPRVHQREKLMKEIFKFCLAWNRVRDHLPQQTIVKLDKKYASVEMTTTQSLSYFIPTNEGDGVCSIALATYLAKLQNDFIEISWGKLQKSEQATFRVPIKRIQKSQVIYFDEQITNVIFSHCKYSLKAGHGANITYDFLALEKHILDRFVRGKPSIMIAISAMSYRSHVIQAESFRKIRKSIPQSALPQRDKEDILQAVHESQCLQECIDVVNVTLGFVQYGKWKPQHMLKRCLATLKLDQKMPKIIEDRCQMTHLISLWKILNVEISRKLTNGKEDPFVDVDTAFKTELTPEEQESLKQELVPYDIDQFLEVLYEIIVTHVKYSGQNEAEAELTEVYIYVCDYFELERIPNFEDKFPIEFSLKHIVSIWKYAIAYKERQELNLN